MKEFLIGVDLRTQGTKAALFSSNGRCLPSAFLPSKLIRKGLGTHSRKFLHIRAESP
jgi:sugar (pentulose or hexulose) kinase